MLFQLNVLSCELLYLSPPLRRIDLFQFSYLIVIVMIFSSFNTSLHLISPKSISHWVLSLMNKCKLTPMDRFLILVVIQGWSVGCFLITLWGRNISKAVLRSDINSLNFSSREGALWIGDQSSCVIHRRSARHALSHKSRVLISRVSHWFRCRFCDGFPRIV